MFVMKTVCNISFIKGKPRIDVTRWFKTNYGIQTGGGVNVTVKAPIIAYPKPSVNLISWTGPISADVQNVIKERGDVSYKHWMTSTIPVHNQTYFGNYTMMYDGEAVTTITINTEGCACV
jgi:hypothetical protein